MAETVPYVREAPAACLAEPVAPGILRLVAPNPGPFTATGTCAYLVGEERLAIIDPGPEDARQTQALLDAIAGRPVDAILITHTHRDHSPGARALAAVTGAPIIGCGPHIAARPLAEGETDRMEGSGDRQHRPDRILADGEVLEAAGRRFEAVHTPGHTMNHLCFALADEGVLFSGDHVMGWSTTIVAPPDGAMGAYMASLEKLKARGETLYLPGHGGAVTDPQRFVRALIGHRRLREQAILASLTAGPKTVAEITPPLYQGLDPRLLPAAGLSVFAHLEDLVARGLAACEGAVVVEGVYRRVE
jgi:glyoxylase-like metal-dependent hydrolase (beta-lactamase superfamily II)